MYLHIHERKSLSFFCFFLITVVCRGCGGFVIVICFLWHSGSFFPECRPPKVVEFGVNMNALACTIARSHRINACFTAEDPCAMMPGLLQKESSAEDLPFVGVMVNIFFVPSHIRWYVVYTESMGVYDAQKRQETAITPSFSTVYKCTISSSSDYRVSVCVFTSAVTSLYSDYEQLTA